MEKIQKLSVKQVFSKLPSFEKDGINELYLSDSSLASDKNTLMQLADKIAEECPGLFLSVRVNPAILDYKLLEKLSQIYCSLEIPFEGTVKNDKLLFDKKFHSSKAKLLNDSGVVFGFDMDFAGQKGDTFKSFRERLDFAVSLYPNHIDFARLEGEYKEPVPTGVYSSKDIDFSKGMAFACKTFYSLGRAVPWLNSVLKALKIPASSFFADFEEWQQCNNCSFETGFNPEDAGHLKIQKMQLNFLEQKFEEKNKVHFFPAVRDIVELNGAFSRAYSDGVETELLTSYHPDDVLSPYSCDIQSFVENVTMESCSIKVFVNKNGDPDIKFL